MKLTNLALALLTLTSSQLTLATPINDHAVVLGAGFHDSSGLFTTPCIQSEVRENIAPSMAFAAENFVFGEDILRALGASGFSENLIQIDEKTKLANDWSSNDTRATHFVSFNYSGRSEYMRNGEGLRPESDRCGDQWVRELSYGLRAIVLLQVTSPTAGQARTVLANLPELTADAEDVTVKVVARQFGGKRLIAYPQLPPDGIECSLVNVAKCIEAFNSVTARWKTLSKEGFFEQTNLTPISYELSAY